jgi:hypothetical protein
MTAVPMMPVMVVPVVMRVPAHFGRHLPRSELLIILDRGSRTRIDQRRRSSSLGGCGEIQQRGGCGKAQNSRHGHYIFSFRGSNSVLTGQSGQPTRRNAGATLAHAT